MAFRRDDLKPGMLVRVRSGAMYMVAPTRGKSLALVRSDDDHALSSCPYFRVDDLNDTLLNEGGLGKALDVMDVWSESWHHAYALSFTTAGRDRLWTRRPKVKKMTVAEICEALGCDVEVISDEERGYKIGDRVRMLETGPFACGCVGRVGTIIDRAANGELTIGEIEGKPATLHQGFYANDGQKAVELVRCCSSEGGEND